eukprot:INCI14050.1.p1 GENE.INCI14050.1~~INCI14050.1.p1  ORF type:complete len:110 (-),score=6.25 INCI14050.1:440-769(-)
MSQALAQLTLFYFKVQATARTVASKSLSTLKHAGSSCRKSFVVCICCPVQACMSWCCVPCYKVSTAPGGCVYCIKECCVNCVDNCATRQDPWQSSATDGGYGSGSYSVV